MPGKLFGLLHDKFRQSLFGDLAHNFLSAIAEQGGNVNEITVGRRDATNVTMTMLPADVADSTAYSVTVQGVVFSYTSGVSATAEEILNKAKPKTEF